jgi:hypothetical protein
VALGAVADHGEGVVLEVPVCQLTRSAGRQGSWKIFRGESQGAMEKTGKGK